MNESTIWDLIDVYFKENSHTLVRHHIDSYNQFVEEDISQILRDNNPVKVRLNMDESIQDFRTKCDLYLGGKDGSRVYFGKPIINDPNNTHFMYPNEARLREMTYAMTIHYDIDVEYTRILGEDDVPTDVDENGYMTFSNIGTDNENEKNGNILKENRTPSEMAKLRENAKGSITGNVQVVKMRLEKVYLGKFPIMVQSNVCILNNNPRLMRFALGECKNDKGGYFIIDGKEKVVVPQETFGDNMINISKSSDDAYLYSVDIKSISENLSKPRRTLSIRIMSSTATKPALNIGVFIPNAGEYPIPLFVVFRALGIITDRDIISFCTFCHPDEIPGAFIPYLEACVHDASSIMTQNEAFEYIACVVKGRSMWRAQQIMADFFLPHVGELNFMEKAYFIGYLVNRLMLVAIGIEPPTDRDSYKYKRVSLIGPLLKNLFSDYYQMQLKYINLQIETIHVYNTKAYKDVGVLIQEKYDDIFQKRMVEEGIRKAFKGNWGAHSHTKIIGVLQDMNRISHNSMMNHLRKTNLPMDSSLKIVAPRVLHGSQWGIIDPIDTPDGGNVGLHKHMSLMTHITTSLSREPIIEWIKKNTPLLSLEQCHPVRIGKFTKVLVNGHWIGVIANPMEMVKNIRLQRRHGLIPITVSIMFDIARNSIFISTDGGRMCRPIFYKDEITNEYCFENKSIWSKIENLLNKRSTDSKLLLWNSIISGFHPKKIANYNPYKNVFYEWKDLYDVNPTEIKHNKCLLEYLDTQETEGTLIAMSSHDVINNKNTHMNYTHCELHPSTTYGMMCNLINFVEHNPASRNSFSCGQSKQACSLYSTNYQVRMDKSAIVLNQGQIPLIKSRYLEYINNEENPYGENAIVAIMCYTGYNVEDAILINEAALERGLFRTTYFNTYSSREEKEIKHQVVVREKLFSNVQYAENVAAKRIDPDFDYSYLDENGLILENTEVHDKMVLIGQTEQVDTKGNVRDVSILPKKGQMGFVDKVLLTEGEEGERIAKVRVRHERIPAMGDKFASRAGQKGTIGMVIPEADMPFTKDGIRPDMIINPHALPSRMTIGQMIECILGKACTMQGTFGDCTAFSNNKNKLTVFGELLTRHNFHSSGDEIMYNGMNGKQLEASIFIGPTYYMRLKHMVKDKINYRARGPRTNLTRQPVSGRANDGGLRIGEMERDAVISHGMSYFLQESMMERADKFQLAICNHTGMVSIYNPNRDIMISPAVDGPVGYSGSLHHDGETEVKQMTKYGRNFSIVQVPYSFKLLMQELQAMQVQMRIITEDNVEQIANMKQSHNMKFLLKDDGAKIDITLERIKQKIENNKAPLEDDIYKLLSSTVEEMKNPEPTEDDNVLDTMIKEIHNTNPVEDGAETEDDDDDDYDDDNPVIRIKPVEEMEEVEIVPTPTPKPNAGPNVELRENEVLRESDKYPGNFYIFNTITGKSTWVTNEGARIGEDTRTAVRGGNLNDLPLALGSNVYIRSTTGTEIDPKPRRIWKIIKTSPEFYTVSTDDLEHLQTKDSIRLVAPEDVYTYEDDLLEDSPYMNRPVSPTYAPPHLQTEIQDPSLYAVDPNQAAVNPNHGLPIQFAPVIKVFNHGNDMSVTPNPYSTGNHEYDETVTNPSEIPVEDEKVADDSEKQGVDISSKTPIDFSKLIIKKV